MDITNIHKGLITLSPRIQPKIHSSRINELIDNGFAVAGQTIISSYRMHGVDYFDKMFVVKRVNYEKHTISALDCDCSQSFYFLYDCTADKCAPEKIKEMEIDAEKKYSTMEPDSINFFSADILRIRPGNNLWRVLYDKYLNTERWKTKRAAVLNRDSNICLSCGSKKATSVHHKTYEHIFNEPLFDLCSICNDCHEIITNRDKHLIHSGYISHINYLNNKKSTERFVKNSKISLDEAVRLEAQRESEEYEGL